MTDNEIIGLFFARSESAIEELKMKYGRLFFGIARNILKDERDAEEAVSDACLAVWNNIPPERPESLMAYSAGITRKLSVKRYHFNTAAKRNSVYDAALDELADSLPSKEVTEDELIKRELTELLNRFLQKTKREDRVIFVRRYWFSDSVPEIAKRLGITENNVYVRLSRIREKLRVYLEKEGWSI